MGGLIRAAQDKVWSVCNQVAGGKPVPTLQVGLVAYRDKGDDYITRVTDLNRDLDSVHKELLGLNAAGGGDFPEHVNQALYDAVHKINWSADRKTLKIIFLVGDAPPHMDYNDDVKYPETCKKAVEKGILINTVQCGSDASCAKYWKDIASRAGGEFVVIPQAGGVRVVATPHDDRLATLLRDLMDTALIYGNAAQKRAGENAVRLAKTLRGPTAADRAAFAAKSKRIGRPPGLPGGGGEPAGEAAGGGAGPGAQARRAHPQSDGRRGQGRLRQPGAGPAAQAGEEVRDRILTVVQSSKGRCRCRDLRLRLG
jgi:hypothetical protein